MAVLSGRGVQHIVHPGGVLDIPPLPASTILLVDVGSTAHGTGIPGSEDNDELGVIIETAPTGATCKPRPSGCPGSEAAATADAAEEAAPN
jgi:hypothetical protein